MQHHWSVFNKLHKTPSVQVVKRNKNRKVENENKIIETPTTNKIVSSYAPTDRLKSTTHKLVQHYSLYNNLDVFVYCGGKCGSTTLQTTFEKNGYRPIHIHRNKQFHTVNLKNYQKTNPLQRSKYPIQNGNLLFSSFDVIRYNKQCKNHIYVIDSYRTPIERKISSFFQNIEGHIPNYKFISVEKLIEIFNKTFIYEIEEYHSIDEVFDYFGLPKFITFDFEKKYNVVQTKKITFIKIRFSEIDQWGPILSEIFGKTIKIHSDNLTEDKPIYDLYIEFKLKYRVPEKYLREFLLKDENFKIYNSEEEQSKYIEKWENAVVLKNGVV